MRRILPLVSVLGLVGAGAAVVAWSVLSRPEVSSITREAASSFDLKTDPTPAREAAPPATPAAAVPSSLTRPIADPGMAAGGAPKKGPEPRRGFASPRAEAWAMKQTSLAALAARPAAFLMRHSPLGSARELRAFLGDPRRIDAYMNSPLTRIALNSEVVAKTVLGNQAVIRAFLATPALSDPQSTRALLSSPMVRKMLDCPAVQEAISDPVVTRRMLADPEIVSWIGAHPQALMAIVETAPALGEAFTSKTSR